MQPYQSDLLNFSFLNSIAKGNNNILLKYIQIFLDDTPPQVASLEKAFTEKNWQDIESIAHSLKSQLNFVGASTVSTLAAEVKEAAEESSKREFLPRRIGTFKTQFNLVYDELKSVAEKLPV